jgi:hypothetical protein
MVSDIVTLSSTLSAHVARSFYFGPNRFFPRRANISELQNGFAEEPSSAENSAVELLRTPIRLVREWLAPASVQQQILLNRHCPRGTPLPRTSQAGAIIEGGQAGPAVDRCPTTIGPITIVWT